MINNFPQPIWVDTSEKLKSMVSRLLKESVIGVDTESNSLYAYSEKVCLIQISTRDEDYLVDPFPLNKLDDLNAVFSSNAIEKIFHAADYDIGCLKRDFGFSINNTFDTMIAGRTLGVSSIGLASMLESEIGVHLIKKYQRANWGKRPLTPDMINYAQKDSHYLIPLYDVLKERLNNFNLLGFFKEECRYLEKYASAQENNAKDIWRVRGVKDLNSSQLRSFQSLFNLREEIAEQKNKPPFKIISNQILIEIAKAQPERIQDLRRIKSIGKNNIRCYGELFLEVIKKSAKNKTPRKKYHQPVDRGLQKRLELLNNWRRDQGQALNIPSDVVLPKDVLHSIANENPKSYERLAEIMIDLPIRYTTYGKNIYEALKGVPGK